MQIFLRINREKVILLVIIILAITLRLYGLNWDQGFHLHPDERAIVMFTSSLQFPKSLDGFMSPQSSWNPHFFAYGNFPLYLLKTAGLLAGSLDPGFAIYDKINLVGRFISVLADLGTIIILFLLTKKIFNKNIGLVASFFYTISVFPIQAAHFYAVDTLLTFFIILTLYQLVRFYEKPSIKNSLLAGIFFGLSLATKISAIPLIIAIIAAIAADFVLLFVKQPHKPHIWLPHLPRFLKQLILYGVTVAISTIITFSILQPYAIIDFQEFLKQNLLQSQMTHNAFIFPYTLQYVGKIPYLYEIKNVFFWGLGPFFATISFIGIMYFLYSIFKKAKKETIAKEIILFTFFLTYFLVVGRFAVGWMRYMLPLYPLLCLFGAILIYGIDKYLKYKLKSKLILNTLYLILFTSLLIWPLSFMHIYTKPNTRVLASQWIYENIPSHKILAREHWDDGLPIGRNTYYNILELPIYEMENPIKESQIYQTVQQSDYIIVASNRLHAPLQRLAKNCQKWNLPQERCSHNANKYYEKLFNGELGYEKVAEFFLYPTIPILNIPINDETADESFTVYDHPKIMIFKKD